MDILASPGADLIAGKWIRPFTQGTGAAALWQIGGSGLRLV
jgi:hypothetical protein